jgi:hypothetical protein
MISITVRIVLKTPRTMNGKKRNAQNHTSINPNSNLSCAQSHTMVSIGGRVPQATDTYHAEWERNVEVISYVFGADKQADHSANNRKQSDHSGLPYFAGCATLEEPSCFGPYVEGLKQIPRKAEVKEPKECPSKRHAGGVVVEQPGVPLADGVTVPCDGSHDEHARAQRQGGAAA